MELFPAFLESLPTFEHSEEIVLTTDKVSTLMSDIEASLPAVALGHARAMTLASTRSSPTTTTGDSASTGIFGSYGSGSSGLAGAGRQDTTRPDSLHDARRIRSAAAGRNPVLLGQ
jgi:hypothetical protein